MEEVNARQKLNEVMSASKGVLDTLGVANISLGGTEQSLTMDVEELSSALSKLRRAESLQSEANDGASDSAKKLAAKYSYLDEIIGRLEKGSSSLSGTINKRKKDFQTVSKGVKQYSAAIKENHKLTEEESAALKNLEKTLKKKGLT